jgi:radical SAM protein with 4Fe4S-binding SPASM domain
MCYFWGESGTYINHKAKPKVLDFNIVKRLVKELETAEKKPFYSLFGGEPLSYPRLEELILLIKDSGAFIDTPTNGTFLTDKAKMLIRTGFDQIRVSLDGTKDINDYQRGKGSYEKAINGINDLHNEKKKLRSKTPRIGILYTITQNNFSSIEDFFINNPDLEYEALSQVTFQMQNFITKDMGEHFDNFLRKEFNFSTEKRWKGLVRDIKELNDIDVSILSKQVNNVCIELEKHNVRSILLPPTYSPENLTAYLKADWQNMIDQYDTCPTPWTGVEITASGEVTPCHIFHDFILGNLNESSFSEIWNGDKYSKFRDYMKKNTFMPICNIGCCILYLAGKKKS